MVHAIRDLLYSWPDAPEVAVSDFAPATAYSARTPVFGSGIAVYGTHPSTWSHLEAELRLLLGRLRFQLFAGSTKTNTEIARGDFWLSGGDEICRAGDNGALIRWDDWLSIIHRWSEDFCFLPGDYGNFNIGLSTDVEVVESVGVVVEFVLSDVPFDKHERDTNRAWKYYESVNTLFDSTTQKHCMCILFQLPRDTLNWTELDGMFKALHKLKKPQTDLEHFLNFLVLRCQRQQCYFAIVSDGQVTCLMRVQPEQFNDHTYMITLTCQSFGAATFPVPCCLATVLSKYSWSFLDSKPQRLGALNRPSTSIRSLGGTPECFADFDAFRLGWDSAYFTHFLRWKEKAAQRALARLPSTGTTLTVNRAVVPRRMNPLRCPYPKVAIPADVLKLVRGEYRARDDTSVDLLESTVPLKFEIETVLQEGEDRWSQVFIGKLKSKTRTASRSLCLKLFDERLFHVPSIDIFAREDPHTHMSNELHDAETMARREESVYHRLAEFQGTLLPHFYGCHEFVLPGNIINGGQKVLGILMEKIEGVHLSQILETSDTWDRERRVGLFKRIGDIVKLLNASCISQRDWHQNQIMCIERGTEPPHSIDLVLIDFAFAFQPLGERHVLPEMPDRLRLGFELGLDGEMKRSIRWNDYDEDEWPEVVPGTPEPV